MSLSPPATPSPSPARTVPVALVAVGLLITAGVAVAATAAYFELRPAPSATASALTFTDDLGRKETVPSDPARVAVLSASILDSMVRLGLRDRVVAVDCYAPALGGLADDYSDDQIALWNLSSDLCVQVAPSFDFEALLNSGPQLVLASTLISVSAVEEIEGTYHIPVLMLQPPTLSGIEVDVGMLGQIFGVADRAGTLNAEMQGELGVAASVASNLTSTFAPLPTVLVTYSVNAAGTPTPGYFSYGPGSFGQSLIELSSASSISANSTLPYPLLTGDEVLFADPQVILFGLGFGLNESAYATGPSWNSLTAVQTGSVYGVNSNWLTEPDPTMVLDGLPTLLHLLHPSLVPAP